ncbi:ChaN family lipoprotein [Rhodohalobacter sulfatireducens]|uniref:ChaN family lipoprotein n=1 Tax=Rhodohalobacter sulfatireducens TaxID=2911366 RepID=A0ABS9K8J2_9BACT|nr:ChaN family lipoprotein [Rhodohalobacter sulfatireducens]MCG2587122.1 ChaN family lipoprotein [Rhodohalobacter sulfatireducens]
MSKTILTFFLLAFVFCATIQAQPDKPAYLLYDKNGEVISYEELVNESEENDLIFFGEQHDNAIAHWLQLELIQTLSSDSTTSLLIGMEMFEADQQILIDEYFGDRISQSSFEREARLWDNYSTDYKPVLEFAKGNEIRLIATNIPRRYASSVYRDGLNTLDSLSSSAKEWIAPLPVEVDTTLQSYQNMSQMAHGHGGTNLIYSQAIKDATMAHFILSNLNENSRMIHLNGSYHSNDYEGIVWYIQQADESINVLTINTISVNDIRDIDSDQLQSADITLAVPSNMTSTY